MIIDKNYYLTTYKGTDSKNFDKLNNLAEAIIEKITGRDAEKLLASPFLEKIKNAICSQIEYFVSNGETKVVNGQEKGQFQSESIGSYSYTMANTKSSETIKYIDGVPIAPMVWVYFSNTDLLYSGVEHYV